jgi:hypothetical protein
MSVRHLILLRKIGASALDFTIEFSGGMLGSYFGAMVAALVTVMNQNVSPQMMQSSMKSGFGLGFVFWALGVSFLNRVLIQGISRASIGKKVFRLELVSEQNPLTWTRVVSRWVLSMGSMAILGGGYVYAFFQRESKTLHDLLVDTDVIPAFESSSMELEVREFSPREERELQLMIISNAQAERPTASVIRLPVKEKSDGKKAA